MSGREIGFVSNLATSYHHTKQIEAHSPLGELVINQSHRIIGCGQGTHMYANHIRASGYNMMCLEDAVAAHRDNCKLCPVIKMLFTRKTPLTKLLWQFRGPDEFLTSTLSLNPLDTIVVDELGPIAIKFNEGKVKTWVLVAVEFIFCI